MCHAFSVHRSRRRAPAAESRATTEGVEGAEGGGGEGARENVTIEAGKQARLAPRHGRFPRNKARRRARKLVLPYFFRLLFFCFFFSLFFSTSRALEGNVQTISSARATQERERKRVSLITGRNSNDGMELHVVKRADGRRELEERVFASI